MSHRHIGCSARGATHPVAIIASGREKMVFKVRDGCDEISKTLPRAGKGVTYTSIQESVLGAIVRMGFSNARYYDAVFSVPDGDKILVLTGCSGSDSSSTKLGYRINFKDSTLAESRSLYKPVVSNCRITEASGRKLKWIDELFLRGKNWIDIPVAYGNDLLGVLAADWEGEISDLEPQDLPILHVMGSLLGGRLNMIPTELLDKAKSRVADVHKTADTPDVLLAECVDQLCNVFSIAVGAVFRFDWDENRLTKVYEGVHPSLRNKVTGYPESYMVGECLTGEAWNNKDYQHIVSFQSLMAKDEHKVHKGSLDRHNALLGEVTSVLYRVVGKRERQFMLRFMNRVDNPTVPLLGWHRNMVAKIGHELSEILDDATSERRLRVLQEMSAVVVENVSGPEKAMEIVFGALAKENLPNSAVLCHPKGGRYFLYQSCHGELFRLWTHSHGRPWDDNRLYTEAISSGEPSVLELGTMEGHTKPDQMAGHLYAQGVRSVMTVPFSASQTKGVLLCPLSPNPPAKFRPSLATLKNCQSGKYSVITTYASVVGNTIGAAESYLTAEGARNLIGHIGHEVTTPASSLSQVAMDAIREVQKIAPKGDQQLNQLLSDRMREVKTEMHVMGKTMEVAMMMAQHNQRLQLHYRKVDLFDVVDRSRKSVLSDFEITDPSGRKREFRIALNPGSEKLGEVVCDPDLMKQVFVNLLNNAVKYSLPPGKGETIQVDVFGQPQTGVSIVQIRNWGIGIPEAELERIFRPYYRGSVLDQRRAIRGMGLGLYIARRIMIAHRGTVFCEESTPKLDDPNRRKLYEGFETVFEVRLPHTLKEGIMDFALEEWV
jgi:signal transduction histidine kinase